MFRSVCVFCGSSSGYRDVYRNAAIRLGAELAGRGVRLVYGGGNVGLMGAIADAVLGAGGHVTGVIPQALVDREVAHRSLPDLRIVSSMHERKALMADLSDAFIAMPGGFGTFEEFCEIVTWAQLGIHRKPCGLLNVDRYYDSLLALFDRATREGFLRAEYRSMVMSDESPALLIEKMLVQHVPAVPKWIGRSET